MSLTEDQLSRYKYNEESPSCLVWAKDIMWGRDYSCVRRFSGEVVGSLSASGYWATSVLGSTETKVHRIVWQLHNGEIPEGFVIDHINQDQKDNRISNLRCVNQVVNTRNRRKSRNNTSGTTGVKINRKKWSGGVKNYWMAKWMDNGVERVKHFSIDTLGSEEAFRQACEYRVKMIEQLNEQGAGYTERHGL